MPTDNAFSAHNCKQPSDRASSKVWILRLSSDTWYFRFLEDITNSYVPHVTSVPRRLNNLLRSASNFYITQFITTSLTTMIGRAS